MLPNPDHIDRQLARIRHLVSDLERRYRTAHEIGYAAVVGDGVHRRSVAAADPTANAATAASLQAERRLVLAAAVRIRDALKCLHDARQDLREAMDTLDDTCPPSAPPGSGPLVTRRELTEARQIQLRQERRERGQHRDLQDGKWVDIG